MWRITSIGWLLLVSVATASAAVPGYRPTDPNLVVLSVGDAAAQARLTRLRAAAEVTGADSAAVAEYVAALIALGRRTGIERYFGYAEAALANNRSTAPRLQVLRAEVLQHRHDFVGAEQVVSAVLVDAPRDVAARLMRAQLRVQLGKADAARPDCVALTTLVDVLTSTTCLAQAHSQSNLPHAYSMLSAVLQTQTSTAAVRSWSAGIAAEFAARLGDGKVAEQWYREALQLDAESHYPRIAYVDWLLVQGRRDDALRVASQGASMADRLRVALAEGDAHSATAKQLQLAWAEARQRGERGQLRDQARFELGVLHDAKRAHRTALDNFTDRLDPEDVLLLAATATAVGDQTALQQVRQWQTQRGYRDVRLDGYWVAQR